MSGNGNVCMMEGKTKHGTTYTGYTIAVGGCFFCYAELLLSFSQWTVVSL